MQRFTELYLRLDATTSTSEKTEALSSYFASVPARDAAWAVALFLGQRPKGSTSSRIVQALAMEAAGVPAWLFDECRAAVGDLSETIALILPTDAGRPPSGDSLADVIAHRVVPLVGAGETERARIIRSAWEAFDGDQRFVYLKLIRGGFRVGVQRRMLARALAAVAGVEQSVMEHRLAGSYQPTPEAYGALLAAERAGEDAAQPYPFFLASQLPDQVPDLGDVRSWMMEWKWDGIRVQVVRRSQVVLWSRGEELITHQFPEIASAARALPPGTVLDGEVLLWRDDRPLPFASLQTRLNRKTAPTVQRQLFDHDAAVFMAFDVLEHEGEDVRGHPAAERRELLEGIASALPDDTIRSSPLLAAESWDALAALRESSRQRGVEGVMLKHRASPYASGRVKPAEGGGWWKWKVDPYTADAVLVYAYPGSGRRATLYTDYAFAVWGERDGARALLPFTRAYSGLDAAEIEELDGWIRRNTVRKMGPAREVKPERVFEIGFESIAESPRHRAGLAVRFPRILRARPEKGAAEADSISSLRELLREVEGP